MSGQTPAGKLQNDRGDDPVNDRATKSPETPNAKSVMADELEGLRGKLQITKETQEKLKLEKNRGIIEWIFGKNNAISTFIGGITSWLARTTGWGKKTVPWEEFQAELATLKKDASGKPFDLEEFVIAHRALGYGKHKENSLAAIKAAVEGTKGQPGEKQIEIDLRLADNGELYLAHDSLTGKTDLSGFTKADDALALLSKHPDVTLFFDIKEKAALAELDKKIAIYDKRFPQSKLKDRHFISAFDEEITKAANESQPGRPVIFAYFPTAKLQGMDDVFKDMSHQEFESAAKQIDGLSGGSLKIMDNLNDTSLRLYGRKVKGGNHTNYKNVLNVFHELPPDNILANVTHIAIPAVLATPELMAKARAKGLKVVLFGVEGIKLQQAILELQPDLVVSDHPDILKSKPIDINSEEFKAA